MKASFGQYCVRICHPEHFVLETSRAMTRYSDECLARRLDYSGRKYRGGETISQTGTVFLGPPGNADEAEYRIYWPPRDGIAVERFELPVPSVAVRCVIA
jgi:hypothetical protein